LLIISFLPVFIIYVTIQGLTNTQNVVFDHNLWYSSGGKHNCFADNCRLLIFSNNIFVNRNVNDNLSNAAFNNNITYANTNDLPWTASGNTDAGGNLSGIDPQIAGQTSINNGVNNPLLDFTITTGPGNNAGSDGKDIGLLFDALGSANWKLSRGAHLPVISKMKISTSSVMQGSNISVSIEARKN
jgi:hypothetical protein